MARNKRFVYSRDRKPNVQNYPRAFGAWGEAVTRYLLLWYAIPHVVFPDGRAVNGHSGDQASADFWLGFPTDPREMLDGLRPAEVKTVNWENSRGILDMTRVSYHQHKLLWQLDGVLFLVRVLEYIERESFRGVVYAARYTELPSAQNRDQKGVVLPRFLTSYHLNQYFKFIGRIRASRVKGRWQYNVEAETGHAEIQWLRVMARPMYEDI